MTASIVEKIKPTAWFDVCRWYLACVVMANLVWEVVHLPLYTLWQTASAGYIAFAVLHCTAGDIGIASVALLAAVLVAGTRAWPAERYGTVAVTTIVLGIGYTGYSEWTNVYVRQSWAYSEWMPILPGTGIGLSPLLQWLVIPTIGLAWARRQAALSRCPVIEYPGEHERHVGS